MTIDLTIVTPQGEVFSGEVERVVLPGESGDFGVLEGHERFLSALRAGPVEIQAGETRAGEVSEGFAEVNGDRVTVLVDTCTLS
jgi:F-type H+-transporting ATPase subunit epsilon